MRTPSPQVLREIEQKMDEIVSRAEDTLRETIMLDEDTLERAKRSLKTSQLSNLLNLANETDSVKALELFIRYQMGRKSGKGWTIPQDRPIGERVIHSFQELAKMAEEIASHQKEISQKEIHIWLVRLYVGSLYRWFVALTGEEGGEGE